MVIHVRLFAMLRELAGSDSVEVELREGATVGDALDAVGEQHGLRDPISRMPVVMAVNREYAVEQRPLRQGDELALIPPISGGGLEDAADEELAADALSADGKIDTSAAEGGVARFKDLIARNVPPPAYTKLLGSRPLDAEPGHVRMEFLATEEFVNPGGAIQGGFLTAMLDETMGPAALSMLGSGFMVPTLELKVSFLRPARPGRLVADARVVHRGRSVIFVESSLVADDGTLLARASATAKIISVDHDRARS